MIFVIDGVYQNPDKPKIMNFTKMAKSRKIVIGYHWPDPFRMCLSKLIFRDKCFFQWLIHNSRKDFKSQNEQSIVLNQSIFNIKPSAVLSIFDAWSSQ